MKRLEVRLMHPDKRFNIKAKKCYGYPNLSADLSMENVISAASGGDSVIREALAAAIFSAEKLSIDEIHYRQNVGRAFFRHSAEAKALYAFIAGVCEAADREPKYINRSSPNAYANAYNSSKQMIYKFCNTFKFIGQLISEIGEKEDNPFGKLCQLLTSETGAAFIGEAEAMLGKLPEIEDLTVSAKFSESLGSCDYRLVILDSGYVEKLKWKAAPAANYISREESADWVLRREDALTETAVSLRRVMRYIETFFIMLREETAFYIGCLNLANELAKSGVALSYPEIKPREYRSRSYRKLSDAALALSKHNEPVSNDITIYDTNLTIITGANQGGKTTFLRSVGQAQLMAECGMQVAAEEARIPLRAGVFTHFNREEDRGMRSGKLDEELMRFSEIIDNIEPDSLVIMNESLSSTNTSEGSAILEAITKALVEKHMEVMSVTHLYEYATAFLGEPGVKFLQAEHMNSGTRTFRIIEGMPEKTAYGDELYRKIFC